MAYRWRNQPLPQQSSKLLGIVSKSTLGYGLKKIAWILAILVILAWFLAWCVSR